MNVQVTSAEGFQASFILSLALTADAAAQTDHIEFEDVGSAMTTGGYIGGFEVLPGSTLRSLTVKFLLGAPPQGQYSGVLRFYLCKDEACGALVAGSPFSASYQIKVGPPPPPQVSPGSLALTTQANDRGSADLSVAITAHQAQIGVRFGVADPENRFNTEVQTLASATGQNPVLSVRVRTVPIATPGSYAGQLSGFLCTLSPCTPANAVPGSQVTIPYSLEVTPDVLLQSIPTLSGRPEWETFQGTRSHTGYVPVTVDPAHFRSRWTWSPPQSTYWMNPVTTGSGRVVLSWSNSGNDAAAVFAIRESDGTIAWRHDFEAAGPFYIPEAPAVWGARVFVSQRIPDPVRGRARSLQSFDLLAGTRLFHTPTTAQGQTYLAPTVSDGFVYSGGGEFGGVHAFHGGTGVERWFTRLDQCERWTPAVDEEHVYAVARNQLTIRNRLTGDPIRTIADATLDGACNSRELAPVLPGDGSVVLLAARNFSDLLVRYDIASGAETWRATGRFASNPVVAAGMLYVVDMDASRLQARSLATGEVQWAWDLPEPVRLDPSNRPTGNLLLTDNLVFVGTSAKTYAIDLQTHAPAWSTPLTGDLALSSNLVLYIATTGYVSHPMPSTGRIDAIDLDAGD